MSSFIKHFKTSLHVEMDVHVVLIVSKTNTNLNLLKPYGQYQNMKYIKLEITTHEFNILSSSVAREARHGTV